jgi:hypothetical protein
MTKPSGQAAAAGEGSGQSSERFAGLTEAVDAAIQDATNGDSGTVDTASDGETEPRDDAAPAADDNQSSDEGTGDQGAGKDGDQGQTEGTGETSTEPEYYTQEQFASIDIFDLDMERVRPEARPAVRDAKRKITQAYQTASEARKAGKQEPPDRQTREKADDGPDLNELWEQAQESPEGFLKAVETLTRRMLPEGLKETLGVEPKKLAQRVQEDEGRELVAQAINLAAVEHPELKTNLELRQKAGELLQSDERYADAMMSNNPRLIAMAIDNATSRVKSKIATDTKRKQLEEQRKADKQKADAKEAKEKATADQKGSVAARMSSRGSVTPPSSGRVDLTAAFDAELKKGNYKHIK